MPSKELERHHTVMGHVEEMYCVNQLSHGNCHVDNPAEKSDLKLTENSKNKDSLV